MFYFGRILSLILIILVLVSCRGEKKRSSAPALPAVANETTILQDISDVERRIVSIRLDAIRMTEQVTRVSIPLDSVWMIPVGANREIAARMQYLEEDNNIRITHSTPYHPTSDWFISIDRADLENENFGIWFIASNIGDTTIISRETFQQIIRDTATIIVGSGAAFLLTAITPGIPDEVIPTKFSESRIGAKRTPTQPEEEGRSVPPPAPAACESGQSAAERG